LNYWKFDSGSQWRRSLTEKIEKNEKISEFLIQDKELPLQYYSSIGIISSYLPKNAVYIGEGSNTMDIGRTIIKHEEPRLKLDAGTFGVMGVGMPFAIAAKLHYPDR
jgi:2-hydroxyacyl-CoA lyase 1